MSYLPITFIANKTPISVKDFGAVGDGVADDTVAIQTTIDKVSAQGGGQVLLPLGIFRVNSFADLTSHTILRPRDNVNIVGQGYGSVIKIANGLSSIGDWSLFKAYDVNGTLNGVKFSNFRVDCSGNPSVNSGAFGFGLELNVFHIRRGADVHIDGCWVEHHMGSNPCILGADGYGTLPLFTRGSFVNNTLTDCGNDTGGYLQDHSTLYTVSGDVLIHGNTFDSQCPIPNFLVFTTSGTTVTSTAHGLTNGKVVRAWGPGLPTPIASNPYKTAYVVLGATTNTLQLANLGTPSTPISFSGETGTNWLYIPSTHYHGCAIETHTTNAVVTNNIVRHYLTGSNVGADTVDLRDQVMSSNVFYDVCVGFSLYHAHGVLGRRLKITNNSGTIMPNGIDPECGIVTGNADSAGGMTVTEGLEQLNLSGNQFGWETSTVATSGGPNGIFLTNNIISGDIRDNVLHGFATSAIFIQPGITTHANRIVHDLCIEHNSSIDCGTAGTPIGITTSDNDIIRRLTISGNRIVAPAGGTYGYGIVVDSAGSGVIIRGNDVTSYTIAPELVTQVGSVFLANVAWTSISGTQSFETIAFDGYNGSIKTQAFEAVTSAKFDFLTPSQVVTTNSSKILSTINFSQAQVPFALVQQDTNGTITGGAILSSGIVDTSSATGLTLGGAGSATSITVGRSSGCPAIIPSIATNKFVSTDGSSHLVAFSTSASTVLATDGSNIPTTVGYSQVASPFKLVQMDTNSTITGGAILSSSIFDTSFSTSLVLGGAGNASNVTLGRSSGCPTIIPSVAVSKFLVTDTSHNIIALSTSASQVIATDGSNLPTTIGYSQTAGAFKIPQADTNGTITVSAIQSTYFDAATAVSVLVGASVGSKVLLGRNGGYVALCDGGDSVGAGGGLGVMVIKNVNTVPTSNPVGGGILYVDPIGFRYRGTDGTITMLAPATNYSAQALWYIDPSAGNDANAGAIGTPIKTFAEFMRRTAGLISVSMTINLVADTWPTTDPFEILCTIVKGATLTITGRTQTVLSGTFTSVTGITRSTNTPNSVTDTGLGASGFGTGVSSTGSFKKRMRITSGARSGAIAWGCHDPLGTKTTRTSAWAVPGSSTTVTPVATDPYVVETMTQLSGLTINANLEPSDGYLSAGAISISNIQMPPQYYPTALSFNYILINNTGSANGTTGGQITFLGCQLWEVYQNSGALTCENCQLDSSVLSSGGTLIKSGYGSGIIQCEGGSNVVFDLDYMRDYDDNTDQTLANMCTVHMGAKVIIGTAAAFNAFYVTEAGVNVKPGASVYIQTIFAGTHALWGAGAAGLHGVGIYCPAGAQVIYDTNKPTITAGDGDTNIGGVITPYASIPFINLSNNSQINTTITTVANGPVQDYAVFGITGGGYQLASGFQIPWALQSIGTGCITATTVGTAACSPMLGKPGYYQISYSITPTGLATGLNWGVQNKLGATGGANFGLSAGSPIPQSYARATSMGTDVSIDNSCLAFCKGPISLQTIAYPLQIATGLGVNGIFLSATGTQLTITRIG